MHRMFTLVFCLSLGSLTLKTSGSSGHGQTQDLHVQRDSLQALVTRMLWMTEHYPPFHYQEGNHIKGRAIDILEALFSRNNLHFNRHQQVVVFPWARGYRELSNNPEAALLTMAFTEARNSLFTLSEPLFNERIALISKASRQLSLDNINNVSRYVVGVVRDDIGERLLKDKVQKPLQLTHVLSSDELLQMLLKDRVDMIAYSQDIIDWQLSQSEQPDLALTAVLTLAEVPTTIAFNRQVPAELVVLLNTSIVAMKADGSIAKLMSNPPP